MTFEGIFRRSTSSGDSKSSNRALGLTGLEVLSNFVFFSLLNPLVSTELQETFDFAILRFSGYFVALFSGLNFIYNFLIYSFTLEKQS